VYAEEVRRISRRDFVTGLSATIALMGAPRSLCARTVGGRELTLVHTHTGERLTVEYFSGGKYLEDALRAIDHILRDFRTSQVHPIDPGLLDLLHGLADLSGSAQPYQVVSGYRSPATNEMLRHRSEGVASGSLHMKGQAVDIRLADVPLAKLRNAALAVRRGGVGYYPASDFVHVDTGRVRSW
jgi:uncharacterized protein YcbK (DUF882 family)